jgi:hypothetical protein
MSDVLSFCSVQALRNVFFYFYFHQRSYAHSIIVGGQY